MFRDWVNTSILELQLIGGLWRLQSLSFPGLDLTASLQIHVKLCSNSTLQFDWFSWEWRILLC